ncbi:hypothetical protein EXU57_02140 [Segetibacter sp. 3557_3]|uniref:hypothetical protein n=1 Tax=Segetibacter sp. 3557_3 TaxID=2547429 RepID=UPI00105885D0|nr:hypothetical protein [Segetibacter sp. 3557_3]TDH28894.1 hypothetical protein EXU57_02140 [Segetibacter sp. 3557_3]
MNMKKVMLAFSLLFCLGTISAQDFKKVQTSFILKKVEDSKKEIDAVFAKDTKAQTSAEAWLWRARINGAIFADSALRVKYPGVGPDAFASFKKYLELEPSKKLLNEANLSVVDQIYVTYFNIGRSYFDREQWDSSLANFKVSYEMGDLITQNNWRNNKQVIDTFTTLFTGYAAQNAKKSDEAAAIYQKFADLKIGGKAYEGVYDYLTRHYLNTKNKPMFEKYIAIAKELYPEQPLWKQMELAYAEDNSTLAEKMKMFTEAEAGGKLTAEDYITYGNMFFNINKDDAKSMDSTQIAETKKKAGAAFQKAYELDKNNGIAAYNAGIVYNNEWNDLRERYINNKGASPALKAKRDEIDKQSAEVSTKAIEWLEKAYTVLDAKAEKSRIEKNSLTTAVKMLANLYEDKMQKSKGKSPADYDKFEKKFTFYNSKI